MAIPYLWKHDPLDSLCVVIVPVSDVALAGGEVGAHEAQGGGVIPAMKSFKQTLSKDTTKILPESDSHCPLVAGGAAHAGLDAVDGHVPDVRRELGLDEDVEADAHQLLVRHQGELLVPVQDLGQLRGPRFRILRTETHYFYCFLSPGDPTFEGLEPIPCVHDVLCVEVDHLLKANGVDVDGLALVGVGLT